MTNINHSFTLAEVSIFAGLSSDEVEQLNKLASFKQYQKGDLLFNEGEPPEKIWFILDGEVKIFKEYASGKSAILGIFGDGSMVAEVAVIDGKAYPASAQAVTACTIATMKRDDALDALTSNPIVAKRVMIGLGKKLRDITGDLGSMSVQSVIKRLSRFLLKMCEKMGTSKGGELFVELPLTRKDLAECIGTSFEVVVRSLSKLQSEGILEVDGKNIIVKDRKKLSNLASS